MIWEKDKDCTYIAAEVCLDTCGTMDAYAHGWWWLAVQEPGYHARSLDIVGSNAFVFTTEMVSRANQLPHTLL